jgi:acyl carrier protein
VAYALSLHAATKILRLDRTRQLREAKQQEAPVTSEATDQQLLSEQQSLLDGIVDVIVTEGMIPREKIQDDATIDSLGLKSIDIVMILTAIEEKFDVYIPMDGSFQEAKDLKGLIEAIAAHIRQEKASA